MVLNNPLRYFEKGILDELRNVKYHNTDDIFGFVSGRSTHDAYFELRSILQTEKNTKVTFVDFRKAYNTVDRKLLLKIIKPKVDNEMFNCLERIVNLQNVKIVNRYLICKNGVPQGSAVSPLLFNHYVDCLISVMKLMMPGLKRVIAYADDLALIGDVDYKMLTRIAKEFSLVLNLTKSATFNWRTRSLPHRKTYTYLGTKIKSDGTTIGKGKVVCKMKMIAKQASKYGKVFPIKSFRLLLSVAGGSHNFFEKDSRSCKSYQR